MIDSFLIIQANNLQIYPLPINNQNFLLNTNLSEQDWYNYYFNKQNLEQILQNITYIQNCLFKG